MGREGLADDNKVAAYESVQSKIRQQLTENYAQIIGQEGVDINELAGLRNSLAEGDTTLKYYDKNIFNTREDYQQYVQIQESAVREELQKAANFISISTGRHENLVLDDALAQTFKEIPSLEMDHINNFGNKTHFEQTVEYVRGVDQERFKDKDASLGMEM